MNNTGKTIAKNASVLMVAQIITWVMALVMAAFLPRYLGAVGMGKLELAVALWAIMGIIVTFGMNTYIVKEVARSPDRAGKLFSNSIVMRTVLFGLGAVGMASYARLAGYPTETVQIIAVIGVGTLIGQYTSTCRATLNGLERMEYVSISDIVAKGITTALTIGLLLMGYQVLIIAAASILGHLVGFFIQFLALRRVQKMSLYKFDHQLSIKILKASFPFLIMGGFLIFYARVDIVIISLLVSEEQLGWYGAADRLFGTLLFIPAVYMMAVFPALSRMQTEGSGSFKKLTRISFDLLLLVAVPMGLGLLVVGNQLVVLIFGADFANSGPILMVFGIVLILTYQNVLVGKSLIASDRQKPWTRVIILAAIFSVPLDFLLIPWCERMFNNGAMGGALAFAVTEAFMLLAGLRLLPAGTLTRSNLSYAARTLLAGLIMMLSIWWLRETFIAIPILVGMAVYLVCIFILRLITPETWSLFKTIGTSARYRLRARRSGLVSNITK